MKEGSINSKNKIIRFSEYTASLKNLPTTENNSKSESSIAHELSKIFKDSCPKNASFSLDDQKSIENESDFKSRFGFTLGPKQRKALFDLIERHDLSDSDIKAINRIGSFNWDGENLKIGIAGWILTQGLIQLVIVILYIILISLLLVSTSDGSFYQYSLLTLMLFGLLTFASVISYLYLKHYQVIQSRIQTGCKGKPLVYRLKQKLNCTLTT
jgi:hypothetical protein